MAAKRLVRLPGLAVGHVYLAVAGPAADQKATSVRRVFDETNVPDRAVVHSQLNLLALQVRRVCVELHQLHRFVVTTSCYQRTIRSPRHAIYRALVVSSPFKQHRRLLGHMIFSETGNAKIIVYHCRRRS